MTVTRYQFLHFMCHMNSSEYKENLKRQIEEQKARKKELMGKVSLAEKHVEILQKEALGNLRLRMDEIGLTAKTPRELLMKAGELLGEHKKMKDKVKRLEKEVKHLEKHKNYHSSGDKNSTRDGKLTNGDLDMVQKPGEMQAKEKQSLMTHLYEELKKKKALVEKVNKLQREVEQLDSKKKVWETASVSSSKTVHTQVNVGTYAKPVTQAVKPITSPFSSNSSAHLNNSQISVGSPARSIISSSSVASKATVSMPVPPRTFPRSQAPHCSTQPQIVSAYHPCLLQPVGVPVQMVSFVDKDGRLIPTTPNSKRTTQKGSNAKKKSKVTSPRKPELNVTLPSSAALLNHQVVKTVVSPSTPTASLKQSPTVSRPVQPLVTSPVTSVNKSGLSRGAILSPVSLVTSPVTPTPVRQATPITSLPASGSGVPAMVSFAQNSLSFVSPLSPLSVASSRLPTSTATPLSSLSASTQKYLNTFATQVAATSTTSLPNPSQVNPPVSTSQSPIVGRSFPNTDLSTDHSAGIKLLCDLLNDTLPEQPPPVATPSAMRSQGTPSSHTSMSSTPDTPRVDERSPVNTSPPTPSRTASNSPRAPPVGNVLVSSFRSGVLSSSEQASSAQRTPTRGATPTTSKKRTSPFTIDSIVSSCQESQTGIKSRSPSEAEVTTNRSSPKSRNKSPSTNFSIAHITRDMNLPNPTSKSRVPFVTSPGTYSLPPSVSSTDGNQSQRRKSPALSLLEQSSRVESTGVISSNTTQRGLAPVPVITGPCNVRNDGKSTELPSKGQKTPSSTTPESIAISDDVSRGALMAGAHTGSTTNATKGGSVNPKGTILLTGFKEPCRGSATSKGESVSDEVSSSVSSSVGPGQERESSSTQNQDTAIIPDIPLDMIPLPSGKRPSPKKETSSTSLSSRKRSSPVPQVPKSVSPDTEVSSLMAHESLPQSPSISSSVSKAGSAVLDGQAPVLVDSNPCSARSPIPVVPSLMMQSPLGVSLPSFGSVFSLAKEGEATRATEVTDKNSPQVSQKPDQSVDQPSEPPKKKRKRKEKKGQNKAKGALSLLVQYDSDSTSSCGTHTESDDNSAHSSSPVSGTPSPVNAETSTESSRNQSSRALSEPSQEISANNVSQINGPTSKSNDVSATNKKRPSNGKSPVERKKPKGGNPRSEVRPPLVNLHDTVSSMQQLKGVPSNPQLPPTPSHYQAYESQYSSQGIPGYALPGFSLPPGPLNFPTGHSQYPVTIPQYFPGEAHRVGPGYSTAPGGLFPQWRTSYAPMQCQNPLPPSFNHPSNGNNGSNVYR